MAAKHGKSALNKILRKKPREILKRASAEVAEHGTVGFLKRATKTLVSGELPGTELEAAPEVAILQELRSFYAATEPAGQIKPLDRYTEPLLPMLDRLDLPAMQQYLRRNRARVPRTPSLQAVQRQLNQLVLLAQVPLDGLDELPRVQLSRTELSQHENPFIVDGRHNPDTSIFGLKQDWLRSEGRQGHMGPAEFFVAQWQRIAQGLQDSGHDSVQISDHGLVGLAALRAAHEADLPAIYVGQVEEITGGHYWAVVGRRIQHIILQECDLVVPANTSDAQRLLQLGVAEEKLASEALDSGANLSSPKFARDRAKSILKGPTYRKNAQDRELAHQYVEKQLVEFPPHKPTKIALTPTFREDPFNDNNWRFNFQSLRWTDRLRRSYLATKEDKYKNAHVRVIKRWIRTFGDTQNPEALNQTWSDMGTGIRARGMAVALHTYGYDAEIVASLAVHLAWLCNEENWPERGNHLLHVFRGMYDTAAVLERSEEEHQALQLIYDHLRAEISEEGEDMEDSLMYQLANRQWSKEIVAELEVDGHQVPEDIKRRVSLMANIGFYATDAGGNMAQYGDSNNVVRKPVLYGTKLPAADGSHAYIKALKIYPRAGVAFLRSKSTDPDDAIFAMLRVHPPGPKQTHGHDDHGQVLLSIGDQQILRDSGRFDYSRDPRSLFLKSSAAHSVARSSEPRKRPEDYVRGCFGVVTEGETFRAVRSVTDYGSDTKWYRTLVVHDQGQVDVYDYWEAPLGETFELLWQLDQLQPHRVSDASWRLAVETTNIATLTMSWPDSIADVLRAQKEPLAGYRSDKYATLLPSNTLRFSGLAANALIRTWFKPLQPVGGF